jgi:hypothetical protein
VNGVTTPWLVEILLISYRAWKLRQRPPLPSELAATFVVFGGLSLVPDDTVQAAAGWGFVIASALNVLPAIMDPAAKAASQQAASSPGTNVVINPNNTIAPPGTVQKGGTTVVVPGVGTVQVP